MSCFNASMSNIWTCSLQTWEVVESDQIDSWTLDCCFIRHFLFTGLGIIFHLLVSVQKYFTTRRQKYFHFCMNCKVVRWLTKPLVGLNNRFKWWYSTNWNFYVTWNSSKFLENILVTLAAAMSVSSVTVINK